MAPVGLLGELIIIKDNHPVPADTILLDSSLNEGVCYVETSSLDGEKAFKQKVASKSTRGIFYNKCNQGKKDVEFLSNFDLKGECICDSPNPDLNKLDGKVSLSIGRNPSQDFPITTSQLLLKGSILKHTEWVVGFVCYTGLNNKIILNSKRPRVKVSKIESNM